MNFKTIMTICAVMTFCAVSYPVHSRGGHGAHFSSRSAASSLTRGQTAVKGYYRSDGTHVRPHYRTNPDHNDYNNWSTLGNVNPHTGRPGIHVPHQKGHQPNNDRHD